VYTHNKLSKNGIAGLEPFDGTSLAITKNTVLANDLFNTDNSVVKGNKVRSNTLDGIHAAAGSSGNLLLKNDANKNRHDGIHVDSPGNTITKNHANKNVNLGIFAAAGDTDGGKNKAHGNGNPLQCAGVVCS
jgi:parallel beta-helix repeat protein